MADSLTITSTYAGELALPYVAPAILAADSLANNYVTLKENVKKQIVLKKLDGAVLQAAGCDFDAQTGLTLTEAILAPDDMKVNVQLCKAEFRSDWEAMQTGRGYINDQIPPNFQTFLLQYLGSIVAEGIEKNIWHGDYNETTGATTGGNAVTNFEGILAKIVAGTPGYELEVAGAFTGDNHATTGIITHLNSLVAGLPDAIQGDANTKIFMSRKSLFLLHQAMASIGVAGGYSPQVGADRPASYLGFDIVVPAGFPNDTLLGAQSSNLFFGTDLQSDFNQAVVVDMTPTDASDNVRLAMRFSGGVQIAFLGDVAVVRRSS